MNKKALSAMLAALVQEDDKPSEPTISIQQAEEIATAAVVAALGAVSPRSQPLPRLSTRDEAAAFLGVSPKTLRNWCAMGKGPKVTHIGVRAMYARENLLQFADLSAGDES